MITSDQTIALAALQRGELIGLPTETVYGLAADARNEAAVRSIFALKGRPVDHPLIVHLADVEQLHAWAMDIPDLAFALAERFWPGPLTLILRRAPGVLDVITGGQDSIGLRIPSHPVARSILRAFGDGLAAPSANRFGHISPTSAAHVEQEFAGALPIILDGGDAEIGIESTIVDVRNGQVRILRPGHIGIEQLRAVEQNVSTQITPSTADTNSIPRVSGALESHYAPRTPTYLKTRTEIDHSLPNDAVALLHGATLATRSHDVIVLANDPVRYAKGLYAAMRALDARGAKQIWIETVPTEVSAQADWSAVIDRLSRAARR
jgi:L-threonylcarbamoyladenylate synthase